MNKADILLRTLNHRMSIRNDLSSETVAPESTEAKPFPPSDFMPKRDAEPEPERSEIKQLRAEIERLRRLVRDAIVKLKLTVEGDNQ